MDSPQDVRNKRWLGRWGRLRKRGVLRFSLTYGLLYCGLTFAAFLTLRQILPESSEILQWLAGITWLINALISLGAGFLLALVQWIYNELRYRRLGSKYPSATRLY